MSDTKHTTESTRRLEPVRIGLIGLGNVGRAVAQLLSDDAALYAERLGQRVELKAVLVRNVDKARDALGIGSSTLTDDPAVFFDQPIDIVIELAGGVDPVTGLVRRALESGRHVITANKAMLAEHGAELFALARKHDVSVAFEASCGGGIPCVTALLTGLTANRIDGLFGILNGTCNFILTQMTRHGQSYADALRDAQAKGFAEADPTLDVTGADAAQKLAILASLAMGVHIRGRDVPHQGIDGLDLDDVRYGAQLGYDLRLVAAAERPGGQGEIELSTRPCFIEHDELLARVLGPNNAVSVHGHAVGHTFYYGRGAGDRPTASAVIADLLAVACGAYPTAFAQMRLTPDLHAPADVRPPADTTSPWYLRLQARDLPGVMAQVTTILGKHDISLSAVLQHQSDAGEFVPVVITTHLARQGDVEAACDAIAQLECIAEHPVLIRILKLPQ